MAVTNMWRSTMWRRIDRWGSTAGYHGQAWIRSPADTDRYQHARSRIPSQGTAIRITRAVDVETEALICRPQPVR